MDKNISEYVNQLQSRGRYSFTKREAGKEVPSSEAALKLGLLRLVKKRRIVQVREGFFVIVPLEYASTGILPPEWFIHDLMKFLDQPYYVGLLSAAVLHGAAHQQPQEYQVVVCKPIRNILVRNLSIRFFTKSGMRTSKTEEMKTTTGYIRVSNPAVTAIDLVAYADRIGGLDRAQTVLQELSEKLNADMILEAAKKERQLSYLQRLGWLLKKDNHNELVHKLEKWISTKKPRETPLDPSQPRKGFKRDQLWKVIVNSEVEGEI